MGNNSSEESGSIRSTLTLCVLGLVTLAIVSIYHLVKYNREGDFYSAAVSISLIIPLAKIIFRRMV